MCWKIVEQQFIPAFAIALAVGGHLKEKQNNEPMLKFFRRVRQELIDEGKLKRYLIYAVGEIVLVVIGILIALQINNWNEQRSLNKTESEYLANFKVEFSENLQQLELISKNRKKTSSDIDPLMEYSGTEPKAVSDAELLKLLRSVIDYIFIVFIAATPVLEEIKNSGKLVTISNSDLRKHLILWEQIKDPLIGTQNSFKTYRNDFLKIILLESLCTHFCY